MRAYQLAVLLTLMVFGSASAHHSFAMFDRGKEVTLKGEVKEFLWVNPHSWLQVTAPDEKTGEVVEWSIELGPTNILLRQGWKKNTFKPGDAVTVTIHPHRSEKHAGAFKRATLPSGVVMGMGGQEVEKP